MALGVLNNLSAIYAENNLNNTSNSLQTVLQQLSSGSRINSGADDAAAGTDTGIMITASGDPSVGNGVALGYEVRSPPPEGPATLSPARSPSKAPTVQRIPSPWVPAAH